MPDVPRSRAWTAYSIVAHSQYFPGLVQGIALMANREYSQRMLRWVATRDAVIDNLIVGFDESVDNKITGLLRDNPAAVDLVLSQAISSFVDPGPGIGT